MPNNSDEQQWNGSTAGAHDTAAIFYPIIYATWILLLGINILDLRKLTETTRLMAQTGGWEPWFYGAGFFLAPLLLFVPAMALRALCRLRLPEKTFSELYDGRRWFLLSPPRLIRRMTKGYYENKSYEDVLRGGKVSSYRQAKEHEQELLRQAPNPDAYVTWGVLKIPIDRTLSHFALLGMSRSGKTTALRLMLQDILPPTIAKTKSYLAGRAIVFDPKTDFLPLLVGMGVPEEKIHVMNPFDTRSASWDIAADVDGEAAATAIAALLVEDGAQEKSDTSHFYNTAARNVIAGLLFGLHLEYGRDWTFRDFLLILDQFKHVSAFLKQRHETARFIGDYDANANTFGNLKATLRNIVVNYHAIAACWHCSNRPPISINAWMKGESVILLGYDNSKPVQFSALNRAILYKLSQTILAAGNRVDPERERTWVFLDEAPLVGRLPILAELLNTGASRGCSVVMGFQTIQGMERVFGEKEAGEIIGQCGNLAVFRLGNNPQTAEWAANTVGKAEKHETSFGVTRGQMYSQSETTSIQERFVVRPEDLQNIPQCNPKNGLHGYFISEHYSVINASDAQISGPRLFSMLKDPKNTCPHYLERPATEATLSPWSEKERKRFSFLTAEDSPAPPATPTANGAPAPSPPSPPPPPNSSFLKDVTRFPVSEPEAPAAMNGATNAKRSPQEMRYRAFLAANGPAIDARAKELAEVFKRKLLGTRANIPTGKRSKLPIVILRADQQPTPPSPDVHPLEHAARIKTADLLLAWCRAAKLQAAKRIEPNQAAPAYEISGLVIDVVMPGTGPAEKPKPLDS